MKRDADELRRELGLGPKPRFLEGPAPREVDDDLIRALHEGELSAEDEAEVEDLITCFEDWHKADRRVLLELASERFASGRRPVAEVSGPPRQLGAEHDAREAMVGGVNWRRWSVYAAAATILIAAGIVWMVSKGDGGRVVAQIDDPFGRVTKTDRGEIRGLDSFPAEWRGAVGSMIRREAVEVPDEELAALHVTRGTASRAYIRPVGTLVKDDRPTFEWSRVRQGARYQVLIFEWGESEPVMWSDPGNELEWKPDRPLERGRSYSWELRVADAAGAKVPVEGRALFRVIDERKLAEIERQERKANGSHLVLAAIYLKAGLLDEARGELELLRQEQGQQQSKVIDGLLESLAEYR